MLYRAVGRIAGRHPINGRQHPTDRLNIFRDRNDRDDDDRRFDRRGRVFWRVLAGKVKEKVCFENKVTYLPSGYLKNFMLVNVSKSAPVRVDQLW